MQLLNRHGCEAKVASCELRVPHPDGFIRIEFVNGRYSDAFGGGLCTASMRRDELQGEDVRRDTQFFSLAR